MPAPRIALVAGEVSGDQLGAGLIHALSRRFPAAVFEGVAGPRMLAAGCNALAHSDELAVMGLTEVLSHLPRLLRLRRRLVAHWLAQPPDVFIGIDAPEFNLGVERRLRSTGVPTVHYVSPSVWAWRAGRIKGIARAVDLMLTLFPFEAGFYEAHHVPVHCVGHPMADDIALDADRAAARRLLNLGEIGEVVAVLPGSRLSEVSRLGPVFADAVAWLRARRPGTRFVAPMATAAVDAAFEPILRARGLDDVVLRVDGRAREVMAAADTVLLASGTATLEALLVGRPMVVAYRVSPVSAWIARRLHLMNTEYFSLPNLLSTRSGGEPLVDEFIQEAANPDRLGRAVAELLDSPSRRRIQTAAFRALHESLRRGASAQASQAVEALLAERGKI